MNWGPHHGLPIIAPADGRVELYAFGTPLGLTLVTPDNELIRVLGGEVQAQQWVDLFHGWTCLHVGPEQAMYVAVWYPSGAYSIEGQRVGHAHYGHIYQQVTTGPVVKGQRFGTSWDSGVRWEPRIDARAAHVHCCAGAGAQLSPNGDLDGRLAVLAQGWQVTDIGTVPGPQDYETGAWAAGRRRSDFIQAGKPLPPVPT